MKKYFMMISCLAGAVPIFAAGFSYTPYMSGPDKSLFLSPPAVNKPTGEVLLNGDDSRPVHSFTWDWGDGKAEGHWFPNRHTYADTGQNYIVKVTADYTDGKEDTAKTIVYFVKPQIRAIRLPDTAAVTIPSEKIDLGSHMPGYVAPHLAALEEACFRQVSRETIEYVLTVGAVIQLDFVGSNVFRPDGSFRQMILKDPSLSGGGMYSLWFTTPVSFAASCEAMSGAIEYSSLLHEMGHNVTLNFPAGHYYGGKIDGSANAIYSETMAQIFQHAGLYEMINRGPEFGLSNEIITELESAATRTFRVVRESYQRYVNHGAHFASWNDPGTVPDETFDSFMTIAYKFIEHAERQNVGYRVPTRRLCDFLGSFNEDWRTRYGQHKNSLKAEAFRATLFSAALSYAFGMDLRDEFRELNFPIDDPMYVQLMRKTGK
jgi:hypothetical protein